MNKEITWLLKEKYNGIKTEAFETDCARLAAGEPLGYLIGQVPFLNCTIHLESHPLIPRVETEFWTEKAIKLISNLRGRTPKILDLCAGSGAIGVAVAKAIPDAHVTLAEIDPLHLPTIQKNTALNLPVNRYIQVVESDLFSSLKSAEYFDFILTNPPYIDMAADTVDKNVINHEPHLALFGGVAGIEIIARIIHHAPHYLAPHGQLWIEHEPAQVDAITTLAHVNGFTCITHPDQYDTPRYSILTMAQ